MNNLVKNNPTARKVIEMHNLKKKQKENIKCVLCFWFLIFCAVLMSKFINEPKVSAKAISKVDAYEVIVKIPNEIKSIETKVVTNKKDIEPVHISEKGIRFIKETEKFSPQGYWDVNGVTLGWGHKINSNDPEWLKSKKVGDWISKSDADKLFQKDIDEFINPALVRITDELSTNKVYISQDMVDGIASLIYNCGESGFKSTRFYSLLKEGKINEAISCVPETNVSCEGHKERRKNEQALMMGDYEI